MHAAVGDEILIETETLGVAPRRGRVLEVLVTAGAEHYRVAWSDGRESTLFPGADVHVVPHGGEPAAPAGSSPPAERQPARRQPAPWPRRPSDPVQTIMSAPVVEIGSQVTLRRVAETLAAAGVGALVVVEGGATVGVVSERDVVAALAAGGDPDVVWAGDVVAADTVWATPRDSIRYVAGLMWEAQVRHIPLLDEGKAVGIVSIRDVLDVVFHTWDGRPVRADM